MSQVNFPAEVRIVGHTTSLRVVNPDAVTVVADDQLTSPVGVQRIDRLAAGIVYMSKLLAGLSSQYINTIVTCAHIDVVLVILGDTSDGGQHFILEIPLDVFFFFFNDTHIRRDNPHMALLVLNHAIDRMNLAQGTLRLMSMLFVRDNQQTVPRRTRQHVIVCPLKEAGHVTGDDIIVQVAHLYITETRTVVSLEGSVHTHIEESRHAVLYHAVHVVA